MNYKFLRVILVISLGLFSFYYTDKVINFIRETDPIMKTIKKESSNYEVSPINAKVKGNKITPGVNGNKVDYDESFKKMKKYGTYNESLTVFSTEEPTISIDDYYDKYISQGSGIRNDVSLVFLVKQGDKLDEILSILNATNTKATFFVDGLFLENNSGIVNSINENAHELEILSYNNRFDELYFSSSLNRLNQITKKSPKYCVAKYDNKDVLELIRNDLKLLENKNLTFVNNIIQTKKYYYEAEIQRKKNDYNYNISEELFKNCDDIESIKRRYKHLMSIYHPDEKNGDENLARIINEIYKKKIEEFV